MKSRLLRSALAQRKKMVKARAMQFEDTNNHHLLLFASTGGYYKIAGNSVLFYTQKICQRIGRRYKIMDDKDHYLKSEEGIVSVRSLDKLTEELALIDIVLDEELTDDELCFFRLPKVYDQKYIEKMRDEAMEELKKIQDIILPTSPLPALYREILELETMLFHATRDISDGFVRDVLGKPLMQTVDRMLENYINFASMRTQTTFARAELQRSLAVVNMAAQASVNRVQPQEMFSLLVDVARIKTKVSSLENLRLVSQKRIGRILSKVVEIEKMVEREYGRFLREKKEPKAE